MLFDIEGYMQHTCRGLPTIHISNFIHHLLLNLTHIYPIDNALYEPQLVARGLGIDDWGRVTRPSELTIKWHRPTSDELCFAVDLFEVQANVAISRVDALIHDDGPVVRTGKNKEWSDELSRSLTALRLLISGISALFDPEQASRGGTPGGWVGGAMLEEGDDPLAERAGDEGLKRQVYVAAA